MNVSYCGCSLRDCVSNVWFKTDDKINVIPPPGRRLFSEFIIHCHTTLTYTLHRLYDNKHAARNVLLQQQRSGGKALAVCILLCPSTVCPCMQKVERQFYNNMMKAR